MKAKTRPLGYRLMALALSLLLAASTLPWVMRTAVANELPAPEEDETEIMPSLPDGWVHEGEDIYYYMDGEMLTMWFDVLPCEETGEDLWYFFQEDGTLFLAEPGPHEAEITLGGETNTISYYGGAYHNLLMGLQEIGGKTYFYAPQRVVNDLVPIYDEHTDSDVWYAFGADGAAFTPAAGWNSFVQNWDGEDHVMVYYVDPDGSIHLGWLEEDGKRYYFDPFMRCGDASPVYNEQTQGEDWYFFNDDGTVRLVTPNQWGEETFLDPYDGQEHTETYFGGADGSLCFGVVEVDGKLYYLDPWLRTGQFSVWDDNGNQTVYIADENGVLLSTTFGWHEYSHFDEWEQAYRTERYYVDESGTIANGLVTVEGKTYYFDPWLRTGVIGVWDDNDASQRYYVTDMDGAICFADGWSQVVSYVDPQSGASFTDTFYGNGDGTAYYGFLEKDGNTYYLDPWLRTGQFSVWDDNGNETVYIADENGVLLSTTFGWHEYSRFDEWDQTYHTERYYVDENGTIANGFVTVEGKTYYLDPWLRTGQFSVWDDNGNETIYIADENGVLLNTTFGWHEYSRFDEWDQTYRTERYYVDESGTIANGLVTVEGKTYYLDPWLRTGQFSVRDGDNEPERWYITDDTGALLGSAYGWGQFTHVDEWSGEERTDVFYGNGDGSVYHGWLEENGKRYYLNPWLITGFFSVFEENAPERWYVTDHDGALVALQTGWNEVVQTDSSGEAHTNTVYAYEDGSVCRGWLTDGSKTYYLDPALWCGGGFRYVPDPESGEDTLYFFDTTGAMRFKGDVGFTDMNMTLSEGISLNFYAGVLEDSGVYAEFTMEDGTVIVDDAPVYGEGIYSGMLRFTCPLTAKELSQTVSVTLKDASGQTLDTVSASGHSYLAYLTPENGYTSETAQLAQRVEDYGAAAEAYFRGGAAVSSAPIDAGEIPAFFDVIDRVLDDGTVSFYGRSLLTKDETILRLYFAADHPIAVNVDGALMPVLPYSEDGYYTVDIPVQPRNLSHSFNVAVMDTQIHFTVGVYDYIAQALRNNAEGSPICELCKALYRYGQAAAALPAA